MVSSECGVGRRAPLNAGSLGGARVLVRTWNEFQTESPSLAAAGERLLAGADGVEIAFLATVSGSGAPHLAPVCPIFSDGRLFLSAASSTPKVRDLRQNSRFALHSFLGADDEEFQVRGRATEIESSRERDAVLSAIKFGAFDASHPIFHLSIAGALWVHWERVGEPDTRAVRRRWSADPSAA